MKQDHYLIPYAKINLNWIKDMNVRSSENKNFLEENIGGKLLQIHLGNGFLDLTPKVTNVKINKWGCIKLKSFYTAK